MVFFSPKPTEETAEISHDSTSIEDGWYYGSGIETPTSSNDYVYGGQSSEKRNSSKRTRPNYNGIYFNSSSRTSSSMSNSSDAALSQTSSDSSDVTSGSDQNTEADDEYLEADFIGYYLDDSYMAKADIKIGEITFGVSNDHAVNQIIDHNPKNKKIKKGTKVDFVLCKLPDVSGTNLYQAIYTLTGAGVSNIEFKFDESSNKASGTVIKNYFADESDYSRNSKVIIEVAGKEIGTIADFSKETAASVRGKYPNINFIFKNGEEVIEISDIDAALYEVKSQDIPANSPAYEGVTVTLTVEKKGEN